MINKMKRTTIKAKPAPYPYPFVPDKFITSCLHLIYANTSYVSVRDVYGRLTSFLHFHADFLLAGNFYSTILLFSADCKMHEQLSRKNGENMPYHVKIDAFEGPLDLLLHLVHRLEIDIYDIPVAEITEQYLNYIHAMQELELDVASEYLVMAATLLQIKSKMLLPKQDLEMDEEPDAEPEEDPREELMRRLLEYRKYKEAASELRQLELERNLMFTKPPSDLSDFMADPSLVQPDLDVNLYDMLGAFQKLMRRKRLQKPLPAKITREELTLEDAIAAVLNTLRQRGRTSFFELFPYHDKEQIVVTFLAILELMKRKAIIVEQERNFADIFLMERK